MNKLTKQLLSLGLSVVTVAGMVSPVLADDEVPATEPTAETQTTDSDVNTIEQKTITVHITKDGEEITTEQFEISSTAVREDIEKYIRRYYVPEGYEIPTDKGAAGDGLNYVSDTEWDLYLVKKAVQTPEEETMQTFKVKVVFADKTEEDYEDTFKSKGEEAESYIINKYVPKDYIRVQSEGLVYDATSSTYTLTLYKVKTFNLELIADGVKSGVVPSISVPYNYTDKEIKDYIEERYYYGMIESTTKVDDTKWVLKYTTVNKQVEDFTIYINKDGVETSKKIHVSKQDQYLADGMYQYLKINYVPDGYHINYEKGSGSSSGICSVGSGAYRIYLTKNNDKPVMKKFAVKILKTAFSQADYMEGSEVEYHTFNYDSVDKTGIGDYIVKKFTPKGFVINNGPASFNVYQIDDYTYGAIACKMPEWQEETPELPTLIDYKLHFIDRDTNEEVYLYGSTFKAPKKDKINISDIPIIPKGYVFDGDSFDVSNVSDKDGYLVNVYVKKGEFKTPTTVNFYSSNNGKLVRIKSVNVNSQDLDLDKNGVVSTDELKNYYPSGYKISNLTYTDNQIYYEWEGVYNTKCILGIYLEELSTVATPSSSKDPASISGVNSNEVLANSLTKEQKKKYDAAVKEGKKIEFKPVVKNEVNASDKKLLLAYADKADAEVVNAFDIEIELVIDDKNEGLISETDGKLTFKVAIPENLKKDGRKFYVLRAHDGKVEKLPVNEDGTFETDKFSSYMLVYEDVATPTTPETKPEVKPAAKPSTGSTTTTTDTKKNNTVKKDVKKNKKVNTSTKTSSTLFTGLLGISIVGLGVVEVLRKRNK